MSGFNVTRKKDGSGDSPVGEPLPAILDALFDREVDSADPRVAQALRGDPEVARRFRATQRLTDRLARRPASPDVSEAVLAIVHAKKPFATPTRRRRMSPQRLAFAGGLLAGIALVVMLQSVTRTPHPIVPLELAWSGDRSTAIENAASRPAPNSLVRSVVDSTASPAAGTPVSRPFLAMGTSSKYEAVGSVGTASVASVIVPAGNAGDIGLGNRSLAGVIQSEVIDPCLAPTTFLASASRSATSSEASEHASSHAMAFAPGPMSARDDDTWRVKALGVGSSIVNPSDAGISWPPADVAQWLDQELNCGTLGTGFLGGPTREGA